MTQKNVIQSTHLPCVVCGKDVNFGRFVPCEDFGPNKTYGIHVGCHLRCATCQNHRAPGWKYCPQCGTIFPADVFEIDKARKTAEALCAVTGYVWNPTGDVWNPLTSPGVDPLATPKSLRDLRHMRNMTVDVLAHLSNIPVGRVVDLEENDQIEPETSEILRLASALELDSEDVRIVIQNKSAKRSQEQPKKLYLRDLRRNLGLSVGDLARRVNIGSNTLADIESGIIEPPNAVLEDIARELGVSTEDVFEAIPNPRRG